MFAGVDVVLPESVRLLLVPSGLSEESELDVVFDGGGSQQPRQDQRFIITATRSLVCPRFSNFSGSPRRVINVHLVGSSFEWLLTDGSLSGGGSVNVSNQRQLILPSKCSTLNLMKTSHFSFGFFG
jgi:hypothetical protein